MYGSVRECTGVYGSVRECTGAYSTDLDVFREDGVFDQITQQRRPDRIERSPFALVFVSERGGVVAWWQESRVGARVYVGMGEQESGGYVEARDGDDARGKVNDRAAVGGV